MKEKINTQKTFQTYEPSSICFVGYCKQIKIPSTLILILQFSRVRKDQGRSERMAAHANVATALGSNPGSSDKVVANEAGLDKVHIKK